MKEEQRKLLDPLKYRGFTLVELLAVLVILAIVLIIAVPGVLTIINKTKNNAYDRQLDIVTEAAKLYVAQNRTQMDFRKDGTSEKAVINLSDLKDAGFLDKKILDPRDKSEINDIAVLVSRTNQKTTYSIVYTDSSSASYPVFSQGMIPIVYDGTNWVKADPTNEDQKWFDYTKQQWANVATVTEDVRQSLLDAPIGTVVPMDKINTMLVWIPRFKYKLFNVENTLKPADNPNLAGEMMIDVQMESKEAKKSTGTQNGEYLTHPAFTFGNQEVSGIWIGKFETGYKDATTTAEAETNVDVENSSQIIVKPNAYSWRNIFLGRMFHNYQNMKLDPTFGITDQEDPHLIKNSEWGAMAALSTSQYGKAGNPNYHGAEKQVRINNNENYLTGCGADAQDGATSQICNTYDTANGQAASTTGNITGIYDTSGGVDEFVFAMIQNSDGTLNRAGTNLTQEELDALAQEGKYVDVYPYNDSSLNMTTGKLGDLTTEMGPFTEFSYTNSSVVYKYGSWYGDFAYSASGKNIWIRRGMGYGTHVRAGIFAFASDSYTAHRVYGYRVAII